MKNKPYFIYTFFFVFTVLFVAAPCFCLAKPLPIQKTRHLFYIESGLKHPTDIAIGPWGRIHILDGVNSRVKVFSPEGQFRLVFGSEGAGKGEFLSPVGLDVDNKGNIYVADSGNHRVQVFAPTGDYKFQFTLKKGKSKKIPDPTDIAVDSSGNRCYIVDNDNHRILMYTGDGSRLLKQWGGKGDGVGEFHYPFLATVGPKSSLYIVDVLNTRVQIYNPADNMFTVAGTYGIDRGQLYRPKGVAVDKTGRIYVSDSFIGVIQIFDSRGNFSEVLGDTNNILRFNTPVGIAVDDRFRIYVVEMVENRVGVYQLIEEKSQSGE